MNRDTCTAQATTWARPSDLQLERFFRDAQNFHQGMRIAAIIYAVGAFDSEQDWDHGNWLYEWRRRSVRVRVVTKSDYVTQVELLNPESKSVADMPIQVLWPHPADGDHAERGA